MTGMDRETETREDGKEKDTTESPAKYEPAQLSNQGEFDLRKQK